MCLEFTHQLLLIFQLMVVGTFGQYWDVQYTHNEICALMGSTVFMHTSYTHPPNLAEIKKFFVRNPVKGEEATDLTEVLDYSGRVEYFESHRHNVSLKLINVTKRDQGMYSLRITTSKETVRYLGFPGVMLHVTDLRVKYPEHVLEGKATYITCATSCNLTDRPTFVWYKNGQALATANVLYFQSTRIDNTGSYRCAVLGYEHLPSPAVSFSVRYPPKNVSVSISPSDGIVEGSSVTLTCRSAANPPVDSFSWFYATAMVGQGSTYTISKFRSEDSSGEYRCKCSNAEGVQYSAVVNLNVEAGHSIVAFIAVGFSVFGLASLLALIIWIRKRHKERTRMSEPDYQNVTPNSDTYTALQPTARSSGDVYHTLAVTVGQSRSTDDTYTALDPQTRSTDDTYTAMDPESPEYINLQKTNKHYPY